MNFVLRHSLPGYLVSGILLPALLLMAFVSTDIYVAFLTILGLLSLSLTYAEVDFAQRLKISTRKSYLVLSAITGIGAVVIALSFVASVQATLVQSFTGSLPWFAGAYSILFSMFLALPLWSTLCGLVYWSLAARPRNPNVIISDRFGKKRDLSSSEYPKAANQ